MTPPANPTPGWIAQPRLPDGRFCRLRCVNAHDRCYGGAGGPCPYCEPVPVRTITAREIGEQSAHKPLRPFGSALIRYPVREGRSEAERGDGTRTVEPTTQEQE